MEEKRKTELFLERDKDLVGWRQRREGGGAWDGIQACARRGAEKDPARGASPPNHVGVGSPGSVRLEPLLCA